MKKLLVIGFVLITVGCATIPKLDESGKVMRDPITGEPLVDIMFAPEKLAEGTGAVAMLLPPPWNLALPLLGSLVVAFKKKG